MRALLVTLATTLLVAGCGSATSLGHAADDRPTPGTKQPATTGRNDFPSAPPPIRLVVNGGEAEAGPVSYCWSGGSGSGACVDMVGNDVRDLPQVDGESVEFRFALPGARFTADLRPVTHAGSAASVDAVELGGGDYRLDAGSLAPGRYRVQLTAQLPQGEAPGEFVWTIPS